MNFDQSNFVLHIPAVSRKGEDVETKTDRK